MNIDRVNFYEELADVLIEIQNLYCFLSMSFPAKVPGYSNSIDRELNRLSDKINRLQILRDYSDVD